MQHFESFKGNARTELRKMESAVTTSLRSHNCYCVVRLSKEITKSVKLTVKTLEKARTMRYCTTTVHVCRRPRNLIVGRIVIRSHNGSSLLGRRASCESSFSANERHDKASENHNHDKMEFASGKCFVFPNSKLASFCSDCCACVQCWRMLWLSRGAALQ